jgi:hypothetical protein
VSDCRHKDDGHDLWYPMPRCDGCGHRVSEQLSWRPIKSKKLPWWTWLAEWNMRLVARLMADASDRVRMGEERIENQPVDLRRPRKIR